MDWHPLLRDAVWLTRERAEAVGHVLLCFWIVILAVLPWTGMEVGHDFAAFWTTATLALAGQMPGAYGKPGIEAVTALLGPGRTYSPFWYPPTALLIWLPFGFLPFGAAAALWIALSGALYAAVLRLIAGRGLVLILAFPAVFVCVLYGQNALFSAALLGGALASLARYPVIAGMLIGCLAYKPQLAVLAPVALLAAGRWRALVSAAATTTVLVAVSVLAFGIAPWVAFVTNLPAGTAWFAEGSPGYDKFISPFAALRLVVAPAALAWAMQTVTAATAILGLAWFARQRPGGAAEIAAAIIATGFCVPSLGEYDLVIFAVPAAWLAAEAMRHGWLPYERLALAVLYVMPFCIKIAALHGMPLAPPALGLLAFLLGRRGIAGLRLERGTLAPPLPR